MNSLDIYVFLCKCRKELNISEKKRLRRVSCSLMICEPLFAGDTDHFSFSHCGIFSDSVRNPILFSGTPKNGTRS